VALTGEPANGLRTRWEDTLADLAEGGGGSEELRQRARRVAGWPESVTVALARVVHGLSVARKSHRQPLPKALAEMEGLLLDGHGDGEGGGEGSESGGESGAVGDEGLEGARPRNGGDLTRVVGRLHNLAVSDGGDASLARLQRHVSEAFDLMMLRLERKYAEEGLPPLPAELSERDKINALAPRSHCPTLRGHAHMLRGWRNAAVHERSKWRQPPSDADVSHVIQGVMSELERLGW